MGCPRSILKTWRRSQLTWRSTDYQSYSMKFLREFLTKGLKTPSTILSVTWNQLKNGGKYGESLAFCIWQEIDHFQTSEKQCAKAMQIHKFMQKNNILSNGIVPSNKDDRKLPLILTLVFLCVGIVGLVILHNVVKGYLSDRRGAPFIPSFLCSFHQWRDRSRRNCNVRRSNHSYKTTNIFSFHRDDSETPISDN